MPTTGVIECSSCKLVTHEEDLSNLVNYVDGSMGLWSKGYGESLPKPGADLNRRVNDIKQLIKSHSLEIQSILDFGCGNDEMLRTLALISKLMVLTQMIKLERLIQVGDSCL